MGIKIGRYHVFLPKMLKPAAVTLRINLWKVYNDHNEMLSIPKFGLNFIKDEKTFHINVITFFFGTLPGK